MIVFVHTFLPVAKPAQCKFEIIPKSTNTEIFVLHKQNGGWPGMPEQLRGSCPPCPLAGGARGAKVPFWFIAVNLTNCKFE